MCVYEHMSVWKFFGQYYSHLYPVPHPPSQFGEPVDMHSAITSVSEWIKLIKERLSHTHKGHPMGPSWPNIETSADDIMTFLVSQLGAWQKL